MTKNKTHGIDRSGWKPGPRDNEPEDRIDFIHEGLSCFILRGPVGAWCGYVGIPNDHPYYNPDDYNDIPVSVHGDLTYSNKCNEEGAICHIPEPGMPDDVWWLGFDTAHSHDTAPAMYGKYGLDDIFEPSEYKTKDYVMEETKKLAEQLRELA